MKNGIAALEGLRSTKALPGIAPGHQLAGRSRRAGIAVVDAARS